MRMLARSPAGIRNVRYARSRSNLFCAFAAPLSPRYWKFAYNTPEKSMGIETVAAGGGGGGGAGCVVSAGCCAESAKGTPRAATAPRMIVLFIERLRLDCLSCGWFRV